MTTDIKESDLAYIAGFIDGEGYIGIDVSRNYYCPCLVITQRDPDILIWIQKMLGEQGSLWHEEGRVWRLKYSSRAFERIIEPLLPYLKLKRQQATIAFQVLGMQSIDAKKEAKKIVTDLKKPGNVNGNLFYRDNRY